MTMRTLLLNLFFSVALLPGAALPQAPDGTPADDAEEVAADEVAEADDGGDDTEDDRVLETDDESYLDIDEDDFRPSEQIPTDQSIAFPVDI